MLRLASSLPLIMSPAGTGATFRIHMLLPSRVSIVEPPVLSPPQKNNMALRITAQRAICEKLEES